MKLSHGALSPGSRKHFMGSFSPAGLHVLVVDDDPLCLMVLDRMLRQCNYKVTTCNRVSLALQLLRDNKDDFDLVMSDVYMPDEDGFKLLEVIGLELDLPVIMMSANGETSVVMKGITHGACDYLIKPVRMEELRNIWQHVIRRKGKEVQRGNIQGEWDESARGVESHDQCSKKRKEFLETEDCSVDDINSLKRARVNWSIQLHQQFVNAVNQLGVDKAVPKRIVDIMNVQGLTRENVASHLQKYRLYLKRLSGVVPEPCPIASFQASADGTAGGTMMVVQPGGKGPVPNAGMKGLNLGAGVGSGPGRGRKIDAGTMESLAQLKLKQQKQAANRAQVLGGLGLSDARSLADVPAGGLQRMSSLDLSFFLQSNHIDSLAEQSMDALDDLAACSSRTVKLEDDAAIVSGINNKRTYPSRKGQGAVRQGHIAQWNISIRDGSDVVDGEEKHKLVGISTGFSDMIKPNAGFCEMTNPNAGFNKVMGSFAGYNEVIGTNVGFNKAMASNTGFNKVMMRTNEVISTDTGFNEVISTNVGFNEVISTNAGSGQPYLHTIQEEVRGGGVYTMAYSSSLLNLTDDAVSSTNVGNNDFSTGSTATDMSGEAFSESSFGALANLSSIIGPTPLMQNSELDISDYLQLDDGFAYQS